MAQYDLTEHAERITAAGGNPDDLLTLDRCSLVGGVYTAFNRGTESAADRLVAKVEYAARKKTTAAAMFTAVRDGKSVFTKDPSSGWLVVGPTATLTEGAHVEVTKASGETKTVRITQVVASFSRHGLDYATARFTDVARAVDIAPSADFTPAHPGSCAACGKRSGGLAVVPDSSGITAPCCPRCADLDPLERSFA